MKPNIRPVKIPAPTTKPTQTSSTYARPRPSKEKLLSNLNLDFTLEELLNKDDLKMSAGNPNLKRLPVRQKPSLIDLDAQLKKEAELSKLTASPMLGNNIENIALQLQFQTALRNVDMLRRRASPESSDYE